jgi:hypothetical protein
MGSATSKHLILRADIWGTIILFHDLQAMFSFELKVLMTSSRGEHYKMNITGSVNDEVTAYTGRVITGYM